MEIKKDGVYVRLSWLRVFLFLLLLGLFAYLGFFLYTFKTNVEVFQRDPLVAGMTTHNFNSCVCTDAYDNQWNVNRSSVYRTTGSISDYSYPTNYSSIFDNGTS